MEEKSIFSLSPYNQFVREAEGLKLPSRVYFNDVTLREGEQTANVNFSLEDKLKIAHKLNEIGVDQIEVGWPNKSEKDREVLRLLKKEGLRARTQALALAYIDEWKQEVDACINSGADIVSVLFATSDLRLSYAEMLSHEEMITRTKEVAKYAVRRGPMIACTLVDATRSDMDFIRRIIDEVAAAGVERVNIADTVGTASPAALRYLVNKVTQWVNIPVEVHCHNDFGLALANAIAAVEGGATIVDVSVNGLGERTGNPSIDEVATILSVLYGIETGISLKDLYSLSRIVSEISGVPIPISKPLVGDYAFYHKLEIHAKRVLKYPFLYEAIPPETVGNSRRTRSTM
jgi:isopropylmalate/homocitrate/citramalate synthase